MKKILIVGGCGMQARPGIQTLMESSEVSRIVIGDINIEMAERLVEELHNPKLAALKIDAFDHTGMVNAMRNADIVLNCSGPYRLLGVKVLRAAIEAGKHYVDYCDDVEPTLEMLKLTVQAKEKSVTAIIGLGASPGYFNLLAKHAADTLDTTDEINMYWSIGLGEPEGPAVLDHMCHIMSGDVIQFLDGKEVLVPALSGLEEEIEMPVHFGRLPTAFVGHPEPVTMPRYFPGLKRMINKYAAPPEVIGFYQGLKDLGLLNKEPIAVKGQMVSPSDLIVALMASASHESVPAEEQTSAGVIDVKGTRNGAPAWIRSHVVGKMAPLTSIPAALGVLMLARGEIVATGVMPPEACVPPEGVLKPMAELGFVQVLEVVQ